MNGSYDLVVIGGGTGGYVGAIRAAQLGMKTVLIERRELGGVCLNRGCIPTKSLQHTAIRYRDILNSAALGVGVQSVTCDMEAVFAHTAQTVVKLRSGIVELLQANNVETVFGNAVVTDAGSVQVYCTDGTRELSAKNLLLSPGSKPMSLPIVGADLPGVLNSDRMLDGVGFGSSSFVIVGGGVVGVEFATLLHSFGKEVTVIEAADRLLPDLDKEIGQNLTMILRRRGLTLHIGAKLQSISIDGDLLNCCFARAGAYNSVAAQTVLVAVGRSAQVEGLFAQGVVVDMDTSGIVVNSSFQTSLPGVYAVGDVIAGSAKLAHAASAQAIRAVAHMVGKEAEDAPLIPSCIFTDPEIASVGLTSEEAVRRGIAVRTGKYSMMGNGRSIIEQQERGFIKLVFTADTEVLVGAQLMCARATDLIAELTTAVAHKLTARQLAQTVRPHPTFSEGVTEAVEDLWGQAIHVVKRR